MDERRNPGSEAGRALAALRRRVTVPCTVCGAPITGATHRRYCSDACRSRAYRARKCEQGEQGDHKAVAGDEDEA